LPDLLTALGWLAALGIVAASVLAVSQTNIKRMLAYSSVANIGYITMGITLANPLALAGALLHVLNHALMKLVLFAAAGGIFSKMGTLDIRRLRGLSTVMPITSAIFLLASLSMVGIPPTGGFFSKLYLIMGAIDARAWVFVAVIIGSSLLALVYLFRVVRVAFFKPFEASSEATEDAPTSLPKMTEMSPSMLIPTAIVAVIIVFVGIYNGTIVASVIDGAVADLAFVGSGGR
jgi:multicomponent Na+:H+ antiporter subunit D